VCPRVLDISVCGSYSVTRELLCNYLPVLVEDENPTRVGVVFYLG